MDETRRHARKNMIRGAVLLWIVSPLLIGGGIAVTTNLINGGHKGVLVIIGVVIWAIISLIVLLGGFAALLLGVYLWWRSRTQTPVAQTTSRDADRAEILRDLRNGSGSSASADHAPSTESDSAPSREPQ